MENYSKNEQDELVSKVDRILSCIVGDEEMGTTGLVERIEKIERDLSQLKIMRDRIVIGAGVVSAILMLLSWVGERMLDLFMKK